MKEFIELAQGLADIQQSGTVTHIEDAAMAEDERSWSGAEVIRRNVYLADGSSIPMIFKLTDLKERCVMQRLTAQKQYSPASYAMDVCTDEPRWMVMEDLGQQKMADPSDSMWLHKVAENLASIHTVNMNQGAEMTWLPAADAEYWKSVVTKLSVDHFERKMEQDAAFNSEFGYLLPRLREAGEKFAKEMTALSQEPDCMTLTHGDLQMQDGAHIYNCDGSPKIIDFGFARYAPFYIDLAGWFGPETLPVYYKAMTSRGFALPYSEFEERARAAYRYNGFIYLCPSVIDYQKGPAEVTGNRLMQAVEMILEGDFPERKRRYSKELLLELIPKYRFKV